jgi:hypothetical protein
MKSKNFQKSQNKAKIGQKNQNWPKSQIFQKNTKKEPKKPKLSKIWLFCPILAFLEFFGFFGKFKLFWIFWKILYFWNKFAVCHFGGYIRTT